MSVNLSTIFTSNPTKVLEDLDKIQAKFKEVGETMSALQGKFKSVADSTQTLSKAQEALGAPTKKVADNLSKYEAIIERMVKSGAAYVKSVDAMQGKTQKTADSLRTLAGVADKAVVSVGKMSAATNQANTSFEKSKKQIVEQEKAVGRLGQAWQRFTVNLKQIAGYSAPAAMLYKFAAAIRSGAQEVVNFDQALKNLAAISGATMAEVAAMADRVKDITGDTKFSAVEMADAMVMLEQAGFSAAEALKTIDSVGALATATLSEMQLTADLLTSTIRAFGLEAQEASMVSDIMANAINKSKLTVDKLRIGLNYIGVSARQAGIKLDETAASMMLLAENGLRASTIGTGFRQVISKLLAPNEKLAAAYMAQGLSLEDLNPKIVGYQTAIKNLSSILWDFEKNTVNMSKAFDFFQLRGAQAAAVLVQSMAGANNKWASTLEIVRRVGTTAEMAAIQTEGLGIGFKRLGDAAKLIVIAIGDSGLAGGLKSALTGLTDLALAAQWFFESAGGKFVTQAALLTAGIWALNAAFTALSTTAFFLAVTKGSQAAMAGPATISGWGLIVGGVTKAVLALGKAVVAHPIIAFVAVVGTAVLAVKAFTDSTEEQVAAVDKAAVGFREATDSLSFYTQMLSYLSEAGEPEKYASTIKRFVLENKKLAAEIAVLAGVVDLTTVSFDTFADAMERASVANFEKEVSNSIKKLNALFGAVEQAKASAVQTEGYMSMTASLAALATAAETAAKAQEKIKTTNIDFRKSTSETVKIIVKMAQSLKMNRTRLLGFIHSLSLADPKMAVLLFQEATRELNALGEAMDRGIKKYQSALQRLPQGFRDFYSELTSLEKANFVEFSGALSRRISVYNKNAHLMNLTDQERSSGAAAIYAEALEKFMRQNDTHLGSVEERERRILSVVQSYQEHAVKEYRDGTLTRVEAEGRVTSFIEIVNAKYLKNIKETYKEAQKVVGQYVKDLESKLKEAQSKIASINTAMADANASLYDDLRDLRQQTMSDEKKWYSDRAEASRLLNEGVKTNNLDMLSESQALYKSLSRVVKDESGQTVKDIAQTREEAAAGITAAHKATTAILKNQEQAAREQFGKIKSEIDKAKEYLESYRLKIQEVSREPLTLNTSELSGMFTSLNNDIETFKKRIGEGGEFNVDITGTGSTKMLISRKLKEVEDSIDKTAAHIDGTTPELSVDPDEYFENISLVVKKWDEVLSKLGEPVEMTLGELLWKDAEAGIQAVEAMSIYYEAKTKGMADDALSMGVEISNGLSGEAEFLTIFTGEGSDKKKITAKIAEVEGKIASAAETINKTDAVVKIDLDASAFDGIEVAKLSGKFTADFYKFVGDSVDAAKTGVAKIVTGIKNTYSRMLGVKNIFELVFYGDETGSEKGKSLAVKAEDLVKVFEDISKNISTLGTRFDILYNGGTVDGVSTDAANLIAAFESAAETIGNIYTAFEVQFTTDMGKDPGEFISSLLTQFVDLSQNVGDMQTSFTAIFEADDGTPLETRFADIGYMAEKSAKSIGGLSATFTTDFLSNDGLVMTDAISRTSNSIKTLADQIKNTTSTMVIAIGGPEGTPVEEDINEAVEAVADAEAKIDGTTATMKVDAESPDKKKTITGWLKSTIHEFAEASKLMTGIKSVFSVSFLTDSSLTPMERIDYLKKKLTNAGKYISNLVTDFQIGIKNGDISVEKSVEWIKKKLVKFKNFIKGLAASFNIGFFGEEGKGKKGKGIEAKIDSVWAKLKDFSIKVKTLVMEFVVKFFGEASAKEPLGDKISVIWKLIKSLAGFIGDIVSEFTTKLTDGEGNPLTAALDLVKDKSEKTSSAINGGLTFFKVLVTDKDKMSITEKLDATVGTFQRARDSINAFVPAFKIALAAEEAGAVYPGPIGEKIDYVLNKINTARKIINKAKTVFKLMFSADDKPVEKKIPEIKKQLGEVYDAAKAKTAKFTMNFIDSSGQALSGVIEKIQEQIVGFYAIVKDVKAVFSIAFMGSASEEKPLTEKVADLIALLLDFAKEVSDISMEMVIRFTTEDGIPKTIADFFKTALDEVTVFSNKLRLAATMIPFIVLFSSAAAIESAMKVRKEIEHVLSNASSTFKVVFTGEGSSERPIMDKITEIAGGFFKLKSVAEKGIKNKTTFTGDNGSGEKSYIESLNERNKAEVDAAQKLNQEIANEKKKYDKMFNIRAQGQIDETTVMSQAMYNSWQKFYGSLDSLRKIDFKSFWDSTKAKVDAYEKAADAQGDSDEIRIRNIAKIRESAFVDFRKVSEEGMLAGLEGELDKVVEQIGKATEQLDEESAKRLKAYDTQIRDIEMAQIEAEMVLAKKTSVSPNSALIGRLNESLGVLGDLSEKEVAVLDAGYKKKAAAYLTSLSADERYAIGKGNAIGSLKASVGALSLLSEKEQAALEDGYSQKAGAYLKSLTLDEQYVAGRNSVLGKMSQSVGILSEMSDKEIAVVEDKHRRLAAIARTAPDAEVKAVLSAADKIRLIEIKKSQERIATIKERLGLAVSAMETFENKTVRIVQGGEDKKAAARVAGMSAQEKLDAQFAVEREKFWNLNVDLAKKKNIDMMKVSVDASEARIKLQKDEASRTQGVEAQKTAAQKTGMSDREKLDAQFAIEREKFFLLNEASAKKHNVNLVKLSEDALKAKIALAEDEIGAVVGVKKKIVSQETAMAKKIRLINKKTTEEKKKFYKEARTALEEELGKSLDMEKEVASKILDLTKSLADERTDAAEAEREMRRGLMTDEAAYADEVAEVQEKLAGAYQLMKTSPEEAAAAFKELKSDAQALNKVVGEGADEEAKKQKAFRTSKKYMDEAMAGLEKATKSQTLALEKVRGENTKNLEATQKSLTIVNNELDKFAGKAEKVKVAIDEEAMTNIKKQLKDLTQEIENRKTLNLDITKAEKDIDRLIRKMKDLEKSRKTRASGDDGVEMAEGGGVPHGIWSSGIDTVPAWLTAGEFVEPVRTVMQYSKRFFEGLRQGAFPVENIQRIMQAGRKKISAGMNTVQRLATGGPVLRMPTVRATGNETIVRSMAQYFQSGGPVKQQAQGGMPNLGRFELAFEGPVLSGYAEPDALKDFMSKIKEGRRRRAS